MQRSFKDRGDFYVQAAPHRVAMAHDYFARDASIYLPIFPKPAAPPLTLALEGRAMKDDILIGDTPKAVNRRKRLKGLQSSGRLWKHSRLTDIYGLVTQEQVEQFFVFTLVRNPWNRMVSYYHWLREQSFDHPSVTLAQQLDFSGFLNDAHTKMVMRGLALWAVSARSRWG